ncbi:DUF899 family protein [Paracoccus saliphilus]|uniref:DUF899 family protein n=1 Tax=Paracoccus saliphilus TaxID=405559 RepID=A0AA45W8C0_9RHOB|nr:DUF899 family protein [Paracoccus saliphilus]WCR02939.1 DUF899 family protein [Paracoccus saliphilus]SIT15884.1 Predicted dithiol-disulfide oxidoreductase, DUF899 family [Paracoccus saliphilus]
MGVTFPNESAEYRAAREKLLQREGALRREMEAVAAEIRSLPPGGIVPEDYEFDHIDPEGVSAKVRLSELFQPGTDSLILYHFMFPRHCGDDRQGPSSGPAAELPLEEGPCPSCTALLDNWEGAVPHVEGLGANIAAVAKAPIEQVAAFAAHRGWRNLKLLSAANNSFKRDYHGEDAEGQQLPILTVFHKGSDGSIRLSWASEMLFLPSEPGQDPRHVGTVEPMWTLLDLTPRGRPNAEEQIEY